MSVLLRAERARRRTTVRIPMIAWVWLGGWIVTLVTLTVLLLGYARLLAKCGLE